jgi:hypothetical protein
MCCVPPPRFVGDAIDGVGGRDEGLLAPAPGATLFRCADESAARELLTFFSQNTAPRASTTTSAAMRARLMRWGRGM